jgi:hypothetical protein
LKPNTATFPLTAGPSDFALDFDLEPAVAAAARGAGAGGAGGGAFEGVSTLAFFAFVQLASDGLDGAAAPESGTTQTATTRKSDGRSKTPMINRFLDQARPPVR